MAKDLSNLAEVLQVDKHRVVTLIGAGGKTSTMYRLAGEMADQNKRVLVTTTTKIFYLSEDEKRFIVGDSLPGIMAKLQVKACSGEFVVAGLGVCEGKIPGLPAEWIDALSESGLFDVILVEGDGSARKSLKAPAGHEPVVPATTTLLLPVMGLQVLGQPLGGEMVHRPERFTELTGLQHGEQIGIEQYFQVFFHQNGYNLGKEKHFRRVVPLINQVDDALLEERGLALAGLFLQAGLEMVLLTSYLEEPVIRRVCR